LLKIEKQQEDVMTQSTTNSALFPRCKGRQVTANFEGGDITSDGGVLMLRQLDRKLGLIRSIASKMGDARNSSNVNTAQSRLFGSVFLALL
tara:strand:- start:210 stop:482 length:273 start_codon:yes stop_codon:yes gene_type:complete